MILWCPPASGEKRVERGMRGWEVKGFRESDEGNRSGRIVCVCVCVEERGGGGKSSLTLPSTSLFTALCITLHTGVRCLLEPHTCCLCARNSVERHIDPLTETSVQSVYTSCSLNTSIPTSVWPHTCRSEPGLKLKYQYLLLVNLNLFYIWSGNIYSEMIQICPLSDFAVLFILWYVSLSSLAQ